MMMAVGGIVGELLVPDAPTALERALYPGLGGVLGFVLGPLLLFLFFTALVYARQGITVMVTNVVTQVSDNVTTIADYPTPVVMSNAEQGIPALRYLLKHGSQLEGEVQQSSGLPLGQLEIWLQRWINYLQSDVWEYLPHQAQYILSDHGFVIEREAQKYMDWDSRMAYRRVVLDRRLGRLREICSQIPELHTADSQTEGAG